MKRALARGFTLIEMMIVVLIVAVVATIAVVVYRKQVTAAKVSEATGLVGDIRGAQERYKSEVGSYANVSPSLTTYYPNASPDAKTVTDWGASCGGQCNSNQTWNNLSIHPNGPVRFGYATVAGGVGSDPNASAAGLTFQGQAVRFEPDGGTVNGPWYVIHAMSGGVACQVIGSSFTNQLMVEDQCD